MSVIARLDEQVYEVIIRPIQERRTPSPFAWDDEPAIQVFTSDVLRGDEPSAML
jgi:hypothetical protein